MQRRGPSRGREGARKASDMECVLARLSSMEFACKITCNWSKNATFLDDVMTVRETFKK